MDSISHNSVVLLGQQGTAPRVQQRVFVRGITHSDGLGEAAAAENSLQKGMDELQLAMLDKSIGSTASSHLFLHVLTPFESSPEALIDGFKETMSTLISKYATRLLKLRVDEIEIRAHCNLANGERQAVRLVASSMGGQWLKTDGYIEYLDPVTGSTQYYCSVGESEACFLEPYPVSSTLSLKRAVARRIGTTYCYDFLGLMEKGLVQEWQSAISDGRFSSMPADVVVAEEFLLNGDNQLEKGSRVVGTNTVGMVGWHTTLKTPEYPEGRPLVIVAHENAGSRCCRSHGLLAGDGDAAAARRAEQCGHHGRGRPAGHLHGDRKRRVGSPRPVRQNGREQPQPRPRRRAQTRPRRDARGCRVGLDGDRHAL